MKAGKALLPIAGAVLLIGPASAIATLNLGHAPGSVRVDGQAAGDLLGYSIARAGDVNGGGPDLIVGARDAGNNGRPNSGSAYVVYGGESLASLDLRNLGTHGFRIDGAAQGDRAGYSVAGAGDVNGDGYPDVVVGANNTNNAKDCVPGDNACNSGSVYIIYGQGGGGDPLDVDLNQIKTGAQQQARGMEIDGAAPGDQAGYSVAGLGDVNGDGAADVIIGAPGHSPSGAAYVIYGRGQAQGCNGCDPADVNLANIKTTQADRGVEIDGAASDGGTGESVAGPGDVNKDGSPDLLISAPDATGGPNSDRAGSGRAYVVYGGQDLGAVTLGSLGNAGFRIDGANAEDNLGESSNSVAGTGDNVNGDGIHDVIVGARFADNGTTCASVGTTCNSGSAYVIYGQQCSGPSSSCAGANDPADVDLANIKTTQADRGMEIDGVAGENAGTAVAGADVNGDSIPDLLVGARFADNSGTDSGSTYATYGQQCSGTSSSCAGPNDPADLDLATITTTNDARGTRIDGAAADDRAGRAIAGGAGLGVSGDNGHADVLVGAPYANNNDRVDSGSGYVLPDVVAPDTIYENMTASGSKRTFYFHATESLATFQCSIGLKTATTYSYSACSSPYTSRKLRNGNYTFRVFATDAHGNVDPTPATKDFTVP